jgi:hypothetical protein
MGRDMGLDRVVRRIRANGTRKGEGSSKGLIDIEVFDERTMYTAVTSSSSSL